MCCGGFAYKMTLRAGSLPSFHPWPLGRLLDGWLAGSLAFSFFLSSSFLPCNDARHTTGDDSDATIRRRGGKHIILACSPPLGHVRRRRQTGTQDVVASLVPIKRQARGKLAYAVRAAEQEQAPPRFEASYDCCQAVK